MAAQNPSSEREVLREAIDAQRAAQQSLEEAETAERNARDRWLAAGRAASALEEKIAELEARPASADALVAALASGGDVGTLQRPTEALREQLAVAEQEVARWRHAREIAEQAVEARRNAADWAATRVDSAARAVVSAEANVSALLCVVEAERVAMLDRLAQLAALANVVDGDDRRQLDRFVNNTGWLSDARLGVRPAAQGIKTAFDALRADATAPAPKA